MPTTNDFIYLYSWCLVIFRNWVFTTWCYGFQLYVVFFGVHNPVPPTPRPKILVIKRSNDIHRIPMKISCACAVIHVRSNFCNCMAFLQSTFQHLCLGKILLHFLGIWLKFYPVWKLGKEGWVRKRQIFTNLKATNCCKATPIEMLI